MEKEEAWVEEKEGGDEMQEGGGEMYEKEERRRRFWVIGLKVKRKLPSTYLLGGFCVKNLKNNLYRFGIF